MSEPPPARAGGHRVVASPGSAVRRAATVAVVLATLPLGGCRSRPGSGEPVAAPPRLVLQVGHREGVGAYAISDNGRIAASLGRDGRYLELWNVATGRQYAACDLMQEDRPLSVTFHGGDLVVSHADGTLTLWSAATCAQKRSASITRGELPAAVSLRERGLVATADRGRLLLLRGSDLTQTQALEMTAPGTGDVIRSLAASDDGRWLAAGSDRGEVWLVDLTGRGARIVQTVPAGDAVRALSFARGRLFAIVGEQAIRWWELAASRLGNAGTLRPAGIARLEGGLAANTAGDVVRFDATDDSVEERDVLISWDVRRGTETGRIEGTRPRRCPAGCVSAHLSGDAIAIDLPGGGTSELRGLIQAMTGLAFQPGTSLLATGDASGTTLIWDLTTGRVRAMPDGGRFRVSHLAFSPDGQLLAAATAEGAVRVWSWQEERTVAVVPGVEPPDDLAFSADSSTLLVGTETEIKLWRRGSSPTRTIPDVPTTLRAVQLAPGGRSLLTAGSEYFRVWDLETRPRLVQSEVLLTGAICCAAFSHSGALLASSKEGDGQVRLYETRPLKPAGVLTIPPGDVVRSLSFSPDDRKVVAAGPRSYVWDLPTRTLERVGEDGHSVSPEHIVLTSDHRLLATSSMADAARLTDLQSGRTLTLAQTGGGGWVAVSAADQRFDTNDFEGLRALSWVAPANPFEAVPLEVYLRDYFEPRLVPRLLAGERLAPVRPLASLNRARPRVEITAVEPEAESQDLVRVRLEVRSTAAVPAPGAPLRASGACDLRLFRDGQLVAQLPRLGAAIEAETGAQDDDREREAWRQRRCLLRQGRRAVEIPRVRLPRRAGQRQVTLTAYAFNDDRVKSDTATRVVPLPSGLAPLAGTAYVVAVGVNRTESSPAWSLRYAASDAFEIIRVLAERLAATHLYARVVPVRLVSDEPGSPAGDGAATKRNLEVVLDRLAGREVPAARLSAVAGADRIFPAGPEDLVILAISSHGFTDRAGAFHFVLADIGRLEQRVTAELSRRTLSSAELAAWVREVDAGDLTLIVDACQSEASVASDGFRPGPMGSRGLGQLAYDKGMRVLAASKATESAFERRGVGHGLLSYALTVQGLEQGLADWRPPDGRITVGEWLAFAEQQVPRLFRAGEERGGVDDPAAGRGARDAYLGAGRTPAAYQQPVLFDFARGRSESLLARAAHRAAGERKGRRHAQ